MSDYLKVNIYFLKAWIFFWKKKVGVIIFTLEKINES